MTIRLIVFPISNQSCFLSQDYYRAQVIEVEDDNICVIEYVDYGTKKRLKMSQLHPEVMCQEVPILAHKLRLPGPLPKTDVGEVDKKLLDDIFDIFKNYFVDVKILDTERPQNIFKSDELEKICHITLGDFTFTSYNDCRVYLDEQREKKIIIDDTKTSSTDN